ncbi:MAG: branched-chain amino acid transporter permease [Sedimentibacter sp.]
MILTSVQTIIIIVVTAVATIITRFLPFALFTNKKESPYIDYLGKVLPYAAIGLLVVYCLKGISIAGAPYGAPEAIAIVVIAILHFWKENTLLSIGIGTAVYMILVQVVFV